MDNERIMDYDEMMIMKEKRRTSLEKGKRSYHKDRTGKKKTKHRNVKNIIYNPDLDYDNFDSDDYEVD